MKLNSKTIRLPADYTERVYAGVLGKLIGVYLGRPFEQWSHEAISARWGEINRYVHTDQKVPLIVTDDDITGTFTFIRALLDHDSGKDITSCEIGETWLNYIAQNRHILWWGGMGVSTEHTAYLRLKAGIEAPRSGSIEVNGRAVAEEIGAQIFIDGWALVSPDQPEQAARFAREAARVSHDGEAVHGAVMIAVMESLAFSEKDIDRLIDGALKFVPADSEIARMIADLRRWHREDGDWRVTLKKLREHWGYEKYGTGCPMVSNHAVIILGLLYGAGDFDRSMMIVNTSGYDTDCNAGNLGCLLGIRNGLDTFRSGYDWRTPVNDRMILPAADGHWGMMDAANMAIILANMGRKLAGVDAEHPKNGVKYSFALPGSTHGFAPSELCPMAVKTEAVAGGLLLRVLAKGLRCDVEVPVFPGTEEFKPGSYGVSAVPQLYPGQMLHAVLRAPQKNQKPVSVRLFVRSYEPGGKLLVHPSEAQQLSPGEEKKLSWKVPGDGAWPIVRAGILLEGDEGAEVVLDSMDWKGTPPEIEWKRPQLTDKDPVAASVWSSMFIHQVDQQWGRYPDFSFIMVQNGGRGLLHTGSGDWTDYRVTVEMCPMMASEFGLVARVQGLTRYYGLLLRAGGKAVLVRNLHKETVVAECAHDWTVRKKVKLAIEVKGSRVTGFIDDKPCLSFVDTSSALSQGGIGLIVADGRVEAGPIRLQAL